MKQHTILVVEDDLVDFMAIERILSRLTGYSLIRAHNGKEALEMLNNHPVELVITDIDMPVMNGIEFTKKVRTECSASSLPVIAVSGNQELELSANFKGLGFSNYLPKQNFRRALVDLLHHYLN